MQFLAVVALFPLLFWLLSLGCGLLVERLTGARLPALLLLPLGFGTLIVVSQFTTWWGPTAPLSPIVLLVLAILGFALARLELRERWRARPRGWWWGVCAMFVSYALVAAPEIVALRPTFSGYLLDTTGAIQIAGAERLLHYAHDFSTGIPAYGTTLQAYFGNGYPSGGHSVLASVGWLSGQNLIWLYSVYQALELSLLAVVLMFMAKRSGLSRAAAAVTGMIASVPALVYAYALMGSIKEITALPMIVLMGALLVCARELRAATGVRAVLPFGIAAAATLDAIGIAGSAWVVAFGGVALLVAVPISRWRDLRPLALGGAGLAASTALIGLPTVAPLPQTLTLAESVSSSNAAAVSDPGNLLRPLKFLQTLGVWVGESHRVEPKYLNQTYVLIGIAGICVALGLIWLVRRRSWSVLVFVVLSYLVWQVVHRHGTEWTDAKLLVILSPVVVFVAMVGALGLMRARRLEGLVLVVALALGVLVSDGLLYHATNLAPTQRYEELAAIGQRFSGEGPTLVPDFDEYALYLLRGMEPDGPGFAYDGPFTLVGGGSGGYGHSYDLDSLSLASIERFRTIVMRRSPAWSRPPGNFKLAWKGSYYTVWRRVGPPPLVHIPLGGGYEPAAVPPCASVRALAVRAERARGRIAYAPRARNISLNLAIAARSPSLVPSTDLEGRVQLAFAAPGRIEEGFEVKTPGRYELWLGGDVDRPLHVIVDGRQIGAPAQQSGDDGTMIDVGTLTLARGKHVLQLLRYGGDLLPDDAGSTVLDGIVFEPLSDEQESVQTIAPRTWHSLCGRSLDWMEIT
ncbi:MAG TPA: hypothetical protein VMF09_14480 [Solirubrobacteraceae bacterium]|nr:hypothetical protein [Solirubrobacteraceae bacterium]